MKNWKNILSAVFIAVVMAATVYAATDTFDAPAGANPEVGGIPYCVTATGTSTASTADLLTVTLPAGFAPTSVTFIPDYDATEPKVYEWYSGMPGNSAIVLLGTSAAWAYYSNAGTGGIDAATTGTLLIDKDIQIASGNYLIKACR